MNDSFLYITLTYSCRFLDFNLNIFCCFGRLIKTLLEENVNSMSDHITNAMDKMENILDKKIAESDADGAEKSG